MRDPFVIRLYYISPILSLLVIPCTHVGIPKKLMLLLLLVACGETIVARRKNKAFRVRHEEVPVPREKKVSISSHPLSLFLL